MHLLAPLAEERARLVAVDARVDQLEQLAEALLLHHLDRLLVAGHAPVALRVVAAALGLAVAQARVELVRALPRGLALARLGLAQALLAHLGLERLLVRRTALVLLHAALLLRERLDAVADERAAHDARRPPDEVLSLGLLDLHEHAVRVLALKVVAELHLLHDLEDERELGEEVAQVLAPQVVHVHPRRGREVEELVEADRLGVLRLRRRRHRRDAVRDGGRAVGEDGLEDEPHRVARLLAVDLDLRLLVVDGPLVELVLRAQHLQEREDERRVAARVARRDRLLLDADELAEQVDALVLAVVLEREHELRDLHVGERLEAVLLEHVEVHERRDVEHGRAARHAVAVVRELLEVHLHALLERRHERRDAHRLGVPAHEPAQLVRDVRALDLLDVDARRRLELVGQLVLLLVRLRAPVDREALDLADDALERRRVDRRDELVHVREELDLALLLERGLREQLVDLVVDLVQVLAARARDPLHLGRRVRLVAAAGLRARLRRGGLRRVLLVVGVVELLLDVPVDEAADREPERVALGDELPVRVLQRVDAALALAHGRAADRELHLHVVELDLRAVDVLHRLLGDALHLVLQEAAPLVRLLVAVVVPARHAVRAVPHLGQQPRELRRVHRGLPRELLEDHAVALALRAEELERLRAHPRVLARLAPAARRRPVRDVADVEQLFDPVVEMVLVVRERPVVHSGGARERRGHLPHWRTR